jgi:hypothetical protein
MLTNHLRHLPCRLAYRRENLERLLPPDNVGTEHPDRATLPPARIVADLHHVAGASVVVPRKAIRG